VATGLVQECDQAVRLLADVCSTYPERNEALINAGTIAISKETSSIPGFGKVVGKSGWTVVRMSQEHGILGWKGVLPNTGEPNVEADFAIGDKVFLHVQHACIAAAAFYVYFIVDENDVVCETWVPWKGW
jgi:D-serine ammonia-lyase